MATPRKPRPTSPPRSARQTITPTTGAERSRLPEPEPLDRRTPEAQERAENPSTVRDLEEQIRRRAYEIYLQRGGEEGYDVEDWLRAEAELRGERGEEAA